MTTHRKIIPFILSITLAAAAGCKKDDTDTPGGTSGGAAAEPAARPPVDLAAINGAAPKDLGFAFEVRSIDDKVQAVVPVGWEPDPIFPGNMTPPSDAHLGVFTEFQVGYNCDGVCKKKDWASVIQKVELDRVTGDGAEIFEDEQSDGYRLVVSKSNDILYIIAVWWKPDASRYFYCRAVLEDAAQPAADAFEQACRAMRIIQW